MKALWHMWAGGILLALAVENLQAAGSAELILKPQASVVGNELLLGDVADGGRNVQPEWLASPLGASPAYGQSRVWDRKAIEAILASKLSGAQLQWQGSESCKVERPARLLPAQEIRLFFESELTKLTGETGQASLLEFSNLDSVWMPLSGCDMALDFAQSTLSSQWSSATLRLSAKGESLGVKTIRFRWAWMKPAWQAARNLATGTPLSHSDFTLVNVDVLSQRGGVFAGDTLPSDMVLGKALQAGKLLGAKDFRRRTVVKRGGVVRVFYNKGGLNIAVDAVAMEDGTRGQIIPVQNPASRKRLLARVVDESRMEYVQ